MLFIYAYISSFLLLSRIQNTIDYSRFNHAFILILIALRRAYVNYLIAHHYAAGLRYNNSSARVTWIYKPGIRVTRAGRGFGTNLHPVLPLAVQAIRYAQRVNTNRHVSAVTRTAPSGLAITAPKRCNNVAPWWYTNGRSGYTRKLDRKVQQGL